MQSIYVEYTVLYHIIFIRSLKIKIGYFSVSDQKLINLFDANVIVFSALTEVPCTMLTLQWFHLRAVFTFMYICVLSLCANRTFHRSFQFACV